MDLSAAKLLGFATASKNHAIIDSRHKGLSIELENLRLNYEKMNKRFDSHVNDTASITENLSKSLDSVIDVASDSQDRCNNAMAHIASLHNSVANLETLRKSHVLGFNLTLEHVELKLKDNLEKLKKEIIELPSESKAMRSEFLEKIDMHRIDVAGVLKEVRVTRKEVMVLQKNIEAIYSLIDGLKKKAEAIA